MKSWVSSEGASERSLMVLSRSVDKLSGGRIVEDCVAIRRWMTAMWPRRFCVSSFSLRRRKSMLWIVEDCTFSFAFMSSTF